LLTAGDVTVTDAMQVRTYAEEVYTQIVAPEAGGPGSSQSDMIGRALAAAAPVVLAVAALAVWTVGRWERRLPPRAAVLAPPLRFGLGAWRGPAFVAASAVGVFLVAVPLASLAWHVGLHGSPPAWSRSAARQALFFASQADGRLLTMSVLTAVAAGVLSAALALWTCWAALGARRFRTGVLVLMALAWATPGPIVGLGLKETIQALLDAVGWPRLLSEPLWYGPSPLPVMWVYIIRFFPCAVALLWPVVRLTPRELRDAARVDGASPLGEFARVVWPLHAGAGWWAAMAAAVLSLGDLSAAKLVSTPGMTSFAETVFAQMHYGVTPNLAADCLLLLAAVVVGGAATAVLGWFVHGRSGWDG
jgi:iron(III) transport system permease protein